MLHGVGESGQPWRTALLISASLDFLELSFVNILFCAYVSADALHNVRVHGIFLDFKISYIKSNCLL
jgi:hypothetical protein